MNLFNFDQHISVIADIKNIFNQLGHTVKDVSLSGHANIIGKRQSHVPMLSGDEWGVTIRGNKWKEFHELYRDKIGHYDGYICTYPPVFARLYEHFDKPIIIQIPIRYEYGYEGLPGQWEEFNEYLRKGVDEKRIFLVANSVYDQKYTEAYVGRPVRYIPSLCEYTGMSYNPVNGAFLYYSSFRIDDHSERMLRKHDMLKAGHAWQMVGDWLGGIHFPYNISTMSVFEQYTACVPTFFPSKRLLLELFQQGYQVLDQITFRVQARLGPGSPIPYNAKYDPNAYDNIDAVSYWLDYADYYQPIMKHIQYFDSLKELQDRVLSMPVDELTKISDAMRWHNLERKQLVYNEWRKLLVEVECSK